MLPALAISTSPTATRPTLVPSSGQMARARRSRPRQVTTKVKAKRPARPADRPSGRLAASSNVNAPRCGLKASNARTNGSSA